MTIRKILWFALIGVLATGQVSATTTLSQFGAVATVSSSICAGDFCGDDTDVINFLSNLSVDPIVGGVTVPNASVATGSWPGANSAQAGGTVIGGLSVPKLTAGAASGLNSWIAGQALVVQGYTSDATDTVQLNWTLDGNILNPDNDLLTGLTVFVGFFESSAFSFPNVNDPLSNYLLLAGLAFSQTDVDNLMTFTDEGAVSKLGTLSIDVVDGTQFYLIMGLMASAGGNGAMAESLSTLTAELTGTAGTPSLQASISSVPVPAAVWLFGSGLLGLAGLFRRKQTG